MSHPLVLSVMGGAVVFSGQLLPLLDFPLDFDYVHVSRYGDARHGGAMQWKVKPRENVRGRVVLLLDDILDEGHTLSALHEMVMELGADKCYSAVFADKQHGRGETDTRGFCRDRIAESIRVRLRHGYRGSVAQPARDICSQGAEMKTSINLLRDSIAALRGAHSSPML